MAFSQCRNLSEASSGSVAVYLLTDGKPDTSMSMVLNEVRQRNAEKQIVVNTISFNCQDMYDKCSSVGAYNFALSWSNSDAGSLKQNIAFCSESFV